MPRWIGILCFAALPSTLIAAPSEAVSIQSVEVILDGKPVGTLTAGQTVQIVGERKESSETLISFAQADGTLIMGLVPKDSLVLKSASPAPAPEQAAPEPAAKEFDINGEVVAVELARHLRQNRDEAKSLEGKRLKISGLVETLRVVNNNGSLCAEITLRTAPGLPRIIVLVDASEFMSEVKNSDRELRINGGKTLEARSRRTDYDYRVYSYYYGYYRDVIRTKTNWIPVISVGHPVVANGIFNKFHINAEIVAANLAKK